MSISLKANADGSGTLLNGSTPVMEVAANGTVSLPKVVQATVTGQPVTYDQTFGVGQTWQDVTASRALGVTYTNSTGKPIQVSFYAGGSADQTQYIMDIGGIVHIMGFGTGYDAGNFNLIIPTGVSYSISRNNVTSLDSGWAWRELR